MSPRSQPPSVPSKSPQNCLYPLLQDRPCAPPALPEGGLSQIPGAREGADLPQVVQWAWGAEDLQASLGRDVHMFWAFHPK